VSLSLPAPLLPLQSLWATPADRRSVLGIVSFWYSILYLIPTGEQD
jgi:hypothetical protein